MGTTILSVLSYVGCAIAGFLLNIIIEKVFNSYSMARKRKKAEKKILKLKDDSVKDIHIIEEIIPYAKSENVRTKILSEKSFFLGMDDDSTVSDTLIDSFAMLLEMNKSDAKDAIMDVKREVVEKFHSRTDGDFFNGKLFGVVKTDAASRTEDADEDPILHMDLYQTDYFTHKVIERIIQVNNLSVEKIKKKLLSDVHMSWARTSLGLSVIVVLRNSNQIILTRRSKKASYSDGKEWIYVSATETVSETDVRNGTVDLKYALLRGIKEELGIDENMCYSSTIKFYDHFYETHFYQDNIVASVEVDEDISFADIIPLKAKDKNLEVSDSFVITNSERSISKFIKENGSRMRSQTIYSLKSYASRLSLKE